MKTNRTLKSLGVMALALVTAMTPFSTCFAQGTALTYQGRLNDGPSPATGVYDLRFTIHDALTAGSTISGVVTNVATSVSNGLFTVALDFGADIFTGAERWLEIGVRTNGGGAFTTLDPRQKITSTPYAITAGNLTGVLSNSSLAGTYSNAVAFSNGANQFVGTFTGNGTGLSNVNALALDGLTSSAFWKLQGNSVAPGQFLGSTNDQPVEIRVNGQKAMRYEPTVETPNLVGGWSGNSVLPGIAGATISGGGSIVPFNGNPQPNIVTSNGHYATIAGGYNNTVQGYGGVIGGGSVHSVVGNFGFIGGGQFHLIDRDAAYSVIGGGYANILETNAQAAFVGGGGANTIQANTFSTSIGGGYGNTNGVTYGVIGGGTGNSMQGFGGWGTIGGGGFNLIESNNFSVTIAGGQGNTIRENVSFGFIGGGTLNAIQSGSGYSVLGGGYANTIQINSGFSVIAGGQENIIGTNAGHSVIGGGLLNSIRFLADQSVIGGGNANHISDGARESFVGGGFANTLQTNAAFSFIGAGTGNAIGNGSTWSTIAAGQDNLIRPNASYATVGGGQGNVALTNARYATIPGGANNAAGSYSFAAGRRAKANHQGTFVWADSTNADFSTTASNQFLIRASGGVGIGVANPAAALHVAGAVKASAFEGMGAPLMFSTTDNQPLEFKANGMRALRIEFGGDSVTDGNASPDGAPNIIAGAPNNFVPSGIVGATIAGGGATNYGNGSYPNIVLADFSTIGGGAGNTIETNAVYAVITGGRFNFIGSNAYTAVVSGDRNVVEARALGATIAGGGFNRIQTNASGGVISGGANNHLGVGASYSVVAGGYFNTNRGIFAAIGGGHGNQLRGGLYSVIAGGRDNEVADLSNDGAIGGGQLNSIAGVAATVPGGFSNAATGNYSFAAGRRARANHAGSFVWADATDADFSTTGNNQFLVRAGFVGINRSSPITGADAFTVRSPVVGSFGGMYVETAAGGWPFYGYAQAGAGLAYHYLDASDGNKWKLYNDGEHLVVTTGGSIGIGQSNPTSRLHVGAGGVRCEMGVSEKFSLGGNGDFEIDAPFFPAGRFTVRDNGNVGIGIDAPSQRLHVVGNILATGTITPNSDRNAKTNITSVDATAILERVAQMPIHQWRFKAESEEVKHVGPMAQDFYAAFGLGEHKTAIATVDADGVALAAIQGLNQKLEQSAREKDARILALEKRLAELEERLVPLAATAGPRAE